jgi:hypothetical protein
MKQPAAEAECLTCNVSSDPLKMRIEEPHSKIARRCTDVRFGTAGRLEPLADMGW